MNSVYGPAFEMPPEPSGILMCIQGIVMVGLFMWWNGLFRQRKAAAKRQPKLAVQAKPVYEYCEYEKRFAHAFSSMNALHA